LYAGKNSQGELISYGGLLVNVFTTSASEIGAKEKYYNRLENGVVVVTPSACFNPGSFCSESCLDDGDGKTFCNCNNNTCIDGV